MSCVARTPRAAAVVRFSSAANAGLIAIWNEVTFAPSAAGPDVESKCADCKGSPDIKATITSALREGIALIASGTLEVAGQAGVEAFAANAFASASATPNTFARSPIASA